MATPLNQSVADSALLTRSLPLGMLRTFQDQPGFVKYGLADLGEKTCLSISLWETRKDAEASVPVAANWVRENLAGRVELRSNEIGNLAFFEGALARV